MTSPPQDGQRSREQALLLAVSVLTAVGIVAVSAVAAFHASTTAILAAIGIAVLALLYAFAVFLFLQRLRRVRRLGARIALTGPRRVGKTVLSNLVFDRLMEARSEAIEFTAESKSAIATYQAIRNIASDQWPEVSTTGVVRQYRGEARFGRREVVEIELGDTAGEDWIAFSREDSTPDADSYLEWVLSAQAIMHVISTESILSSDRDHLLRRDVQDLKLAARLMRNVQSSKRIPLLIVISKIDLVDPPSYEELFVIFGQTLGASDLARQLSVVAGVNVSRLFDALIADLVRDFDRVSVMFSSKESTHIRLPPLPGIQLLEWIESVAVPIRKY